MNGHTYNTRGRARAPAAKRRRIVKKSPEDSREPDEDELHDTPPGASDDEAEISGSEDEADADADDEEDAEDEEGADAEDDGESDEEDEDDDEREYIPTGGCTRTGTAEPSLKFDEFRAQIWHRSYSTMLRSMYVRDRILPLVQGVLGGIGNESHTAVRAFKEKFDLLVCSLSAVSTTHRDIRLNGKKCDCCGQPRTLTKEWAITGLNTMFKWQMGVDCHDRLREVMTVFECLAYMWRDEPTLDEAYAELEAAVRALGTANAAVAGNYSRRGGADDDGDSVEDENDYEEDEEDEEEDTGVVRANGYVVNDFVVQG